MAAGKENLKLLGFWASPFVRRVEIALKSKDIPYEYVEIDLFSEKNVVLHQCNPITKLVPVLVIGESSFIAESLVIMEYIDEAWKNSPRLLPEDPCGRAQVRFWADFINQQLFEKLREVLKNHGIAHEKAKEEFQNNLNMIEQSMEIIFPAAAITTETRSINNSPGQNLGLLEILLGTLLNITKGTEEVVGVQLISPDKHPMLLSKMTDLSEHPLVKETAPPQEDLVNLLRFIREMFHSS